MTQTQHPVGHPHQRLRRLRQSDALRTMVADTQLNKSHLVCPIFVTEINSQRTPIASLPGVERIPLAELAAEALRIHALGLKSVLLFPVVDPTKKPLTDVKPTILTDSFSRQSLLSEKPHQSSLSLLMLHSTHLRVMVTTEFCLQTDTFSTMKPSMHWSKCPSLLLLQEFILLHPAT